MNLHEFHTELQNKYGKVGLINKVKGGYTTTILTFIGRKKQIICDIKNGQHVVKSLKYIKKNMIGHWFIVHMKGTDLAKAIVEKIN